MSYPTLISRFFFFIFIFSWTIFLLVPQKVNAVSSGWVRSGGELFRFDKNPWFVKNTKLVKYCLTIDSRTISLSEEEARKIIENALVYWKNELAPFNNGIDEHFATVGDQEFVFQFPCSKEKTEDIRFLFGYGSLDKEEIDFLKDPTKFVAVTVRTDYDLKNLKGKGFIFLSSDQGNHTYENSGNLISQAWQYKELATYAIVHELGHVLGLPHSGNGLMSEVFMDGLLHKKMYKRFLGKPLTPFFGFQRSFDVCSNNGFFIPRYFQLQEDAECLRFLLEDESQFLWSVSSLKKKDAPPIKLGEIIATLNTHQIAAAKPALLVHLPREQDVFTRDQYLLNNFMVGPVVINQEYNGFFRTLSSHKPYPLILKMDNETVSIIALYDGKMDTVVNYNSFSLLDLILPISLK